MKFVKALLLLACVLGLNSAWADHWHGRTSVGVYVGAPWSPWYYPPPYYYPPRVIVVPASPPPVYIEQAPAPVAAIPAPAPAVQAQPAQNYWYFCQDSRAYYPYVKECPAGWQRVLPQPQQ